MTGRGDGGRMYSMRVPEVLKVLGHKLLGLREVVVSAMGIFF